MKYHAYGTVSGSKFIGTFEADSETEALEQAEQVAHISLCHQCSGEIDYPQIEEIFIEVVEN